MKCLPVDFEPFQHDVEPGGGEEAFMVAFIP